MSTLRGSPPPVVPSSASENTQLVDIEQPHNHDVLCGRGVTTNRFPGNESFRSLVSLNKELYVTSTKRQKMSISRSIVEAVRSLKPPGRFLEKNPVTGLWSDIGDRKAIEKTSQALRDGAAGLRKELTEDLGDPDFLSAVFEMDGAGARAKKSPSPTLKDKDKPVKAKAPKKGHRRIKSNPSSGSKAAIKATLKKQKSAAAAAAAAAAEKDPSRGSSLPPRPPLSPVSPRSHPANPASPSSAGWNLHYRGQYPPEGAFHYKGRPYPRSHSFQMSPPPYGPPRPPHPPHSWSHAPPRHHRPASPPNVVHTPQSPLPPGRHQLTPNGCISKPPLSPVAARWAPRHFPRHPYGHPMDYVPGRPDYLGPPEYARSYPGPEFWPPHPDYHRGRPHYRGHHDYYYERHPHGEGLDVPTLGGEREQGRPTGSPPQEFTPPVTPSRRRQPEKPQSSSATSTKKATHAKASPSSASKPDRMVSDTSEGTNHSSVVAPAKAKEDQPKDDATQKTALLSPVSVAEDGGKGNDSRDGDVTMAESTASSDHPSPLKGKFHIISVVHQMDSDKADEEGIEFMLKDPNDDDYSLSPLPFEREDPTSLMELPDDILHLPISSCGPHDD